MTDSGDYGGPFTAQDIGDALAAIVIEVLAATLPEPRHADERMEDVAGRLLDLGGGISNNPPVRALILATAKSLIQTETGAG